MKILVVEDDPKLASVLRRGMKEHGFTVDLADNGKSGIEMALLKDYDALVLDVLLPQRSGFDVLRELRKRGHAVPIMMLTARSGVEDRVRGLDSGADDYLAKPFDFQELLARLRAITRRAPATPGTVMTVADLKLDVAKREITRAGKRIDLTAREFALLVYLMRRQGVVVTRGMILEHVWDTDYDGGSNIVEVYINHLRRKIDEEFQPKLIQTVRGMGYILRVP